MDAQNHVPLLGDRCPHCGNLLAWIPQGGKPGWTQGTVWQVCISDADCGYSKHFWFEKSQSRLSREPVWATAIYLRDNRNDN